MLYIIEVPHHRKPRLRVYEDEAELVRVAKDEGLSICIEDVQEYLDGCSEDYSVSVAKTVAENTEDGKVAIIGWRDLDPIYQKPSETDEYSEAWEFLFHGNSSTLRANSFDELKKCLSYKGHQEGSVRALVDDILNFAHSFGNAIEIHRRDLK